MAPQSRHTTNAARGRPTSAPTIAPQPKRFLNNAKAIIDFNALLDEKLLERIRLNNVKEALSKSRSTAGRRSMDLLISKNESAIDTIETIIESLEQEPDSKFQKLPVAARRIVASVVHHYKEKKPKRTVEQLWASIVEATASTGVNLNKVYEKDEQEVEALREARRALGESRKDQRQIKHQPAGRGRLQKKRSEKQTKSDCDGDYNSTDDKAVKSPIKTDGHASEEPVEVKVAKKSKESTKAVTSPKAVLLSAEPTAQPQLSSQVVVKLQPAKKSKLSAANDGYTPKQTVESSALARATAKSKSVDGSGLKALPEQKSAQPKKIEPATGKRSIDAITPSSSKNGGVSSEDRPSKRMKVDQVDQKNAPTDENSSAAVDPLDQGNSEEPKAVDTSARPDKKTIATVASSSDNASIITPEALPETKPIQQGENPPHVEGVAQPKKNPKISLKNFLKNGKNISRSLAEAKTEQMSHTSARHTNEKSFAGNSIESSAAALAQEDDMSRSGKDDLEQNVEASTAAKRKQTDEVTEKDSNDVTARPSKKAKLTADDTAEVAEEQQPTLTTATQQMSASNSTNDPQAEAAGITPEQVIPENRTSHKKGPSDENNVPLGLTLEGNKQAKIKTRSIRIDQHGKVVKPSVAPSSRARSPHGRKA
ncbi:hypothetical protein N0V90_008444 [Kalmusia sp. IMI 367209]|nr:hypothetical protein N0V90_008444 [Kalmusia sp. IMI 367209]